MVEFVRPKKVQSITRRAKTGCGHLYLTIGFLEVGHPIELRASLGKAGGCSNCQNDALVRAVSLGLQHGISVEEYITELTNMRCPNPNHIPEEDKSLSCPDAISRILQEYLNEDCKDTPALRGSSKE